MTDTLKFLSSVLPAVGYPVITYAFSTAEGGGKKFQNRAFDDIESAASFATWVDRKEGDAYFACATFTSREEGKKPGTYLVRREQINVHSLQTLYADIDVKQDADHHNSLEDALKALTDFCTQTRVPCPTLVLSGRGLHIYWVLSDPVSPAEWMPVAVMLKRALLSSSVIIDPTVTTDHARILRPVGTHWRKESPARLVKLAHSMPDTHLRPLSWYAERLSQWGDGSAVLDLFRDVKTEGDLSGGVYTPRESDANKIADNCTQLALMRDTKGDVSYDHWRLALGLIKHCTDSEATAEDWSSLREATGHSNADWLAKINSWKAGPPRCETFNDCNSGICSTCPHFGKINSPIVLGWTGAVANVEQTPPYNRLPSYRWDETRKLMVAQRRVETDTGAELQWIPFSDTKYWVDNYILNNGSASLVIHAEHERPGREGHIDHHLLDLGVIGGGGRELNSKLSSYMINDLSGSRQLARSYLSEYASYLKKTVHEITTYRQFGWYGDNEFLMGDRLVTPVDTREIRLGAQAAAKTGLFNDERDPSEWVLAVNQAYNRPGGEPYQFVVCAGLSSALTPLLDLEEFSGIPIAITSDASGYGKTTVCWVALAPWGNVRRGLNVLSGDEASLLSIEWQASIHNNVTTLFDEQTNRDGQFTSNMLYMLSNGTARARGRPDGQLREMAPSWRGSHFVTGNRNLFHKLTENKANPEAAQMRVFEISLDAYPRLDTLSNAQEIGGILNQARSGYGQIGINFLRYVMANRKAVKQFMKHLSRTLFKDLNHDKERFYANTAVTVIATGVILRELGYVKFDMDNLGKWANRHIISMRGSVDELRASTEDNLSRLLLTLNGRVLVTDFFGSRMEQPIVHMRGDVAGRLAIKDQKFYVTSSAVFDWCIKNGVEWNTFKLALQREGFLGPSMFDQLGRPLASTRINLSKGVEGYATGTSRVIELDYSKVSVFIETDFENDNVITFGR